MIGYATGWNPLQDKDLHKIDTLIFAFAKVVTGRAVLTDKAADRLAPLIALKTRDPKLNVDISVGGWGAGGFSETASTDAGRKAFADSAAQMLVARDADDSISTGNIPATTNPALRPAPTTAAISSCC